MGHLDDYRMYSPRPETPEPEVVQGRRNGASGVQLLDEDGGISLQLERCLKHIFAKYCTPRPAAPTGKDKRMALVIPPENSYLLPQGLDDWARDTNGAPFDDATKEELMEFLDVTDDGYLTLKGFIQVYQLQTEADEEETWRDLSAHGFDRRLRLVTTRREEMDWETASALSLNRSIF